uniref:Calpain-3-like n=1 Tax=Sinocyclocheilus anshuiensis TaxID=1608454 RepID=A0A671PZ52_9TELE
MLLYLADSCMFSRRVIGAEIEGDSVVSPHFHLSAVSWRRELSYGNACLNAIFTSHHCDSFFWQDMQINANELRTVLNRVVAKHKELKTEGFSLESCRSMIALMDVSFTRSAVHYGQIMYVCAKSHWAKSSHANRNQHNQEFPIFLCPSGFQLNNQLYDIICMRYANEHMEMDFDSYISCLVRLEGMFRAFRAFDKDGDGIIKLNVFEVSSIFFS